MKKSILLIALLSLVSLNAVAGGNIVAGKAAVEKAGCAACHGTDFKSPVDPSYPKLAGQHKDYIAQALKEYQRGATGANGRNNAIMGAQAKNLTDVEMHDIGAYLHSLPGTLVLKR